MTLQQTPEIPLPPIPPDFPVIVQRGGPPEELFIMLIAALAIVVAGIVLYPLARALARRLEGGRISDEMRTELDQLHDRVEQLERVEARVYELENRVEFSERVLSRQRAALPEGERE